MAILLTGGTGKTSARIVPLLQDAKIPFVLASRKTAAKALSNAPSVKFDFFDASTFKTPFEYDFPDGQRISAIYLVAPQASDPVPSMTSFISYAMQEQNVKRFVLLAGSTIEPTTPRIGQVWKYLIYTGAEYCVLRATWFMENFSEWQYVNSIKSEGRIYTACGDGKAPFVSAADIAAVAFRTLTASTLEIPDYRVLGPELLTYDQIAEKFSNVLGRKVEHVRISAEQVKQRFMDLGLSESAAAFMAWLDSPHTAQGGEERENDVVERVTGRKPELFDDWVARNKHIWT